MYLEDSRLSKERKALALLNADIERLEQELAKKKNDYWQRVAALGQKVSPVERSGSVDKSGESESEPAEVAAAAKANETERAPKSAKAARNEPDAVEQEEADPMLEELLATVRDHRDGLRVEDIRAQLGWEKNDVKRVVDAALEAGQLTKKGDRRSATYHVR